MRKHRGLFIVLMLLAGAGALSLEGACTIVNGLSVPEAASAAGDGGGDGGDAAVDPCKHARPPAPPAIDPKAPAGSEIMIIVAKELSFGIDGGSFEPISYDLDGLCTCFPHPDSCTPNTKPTPKPKCDDLGGGQDNAGQPLIKEAKEQGKLDFQKAANDSVVGGGRAVIIRVQDYNGLPNDPEVRASVLVSPGLFNGDVPMTPTFTATDRWSIDKKAAYDKNGSLIPFDTKPGYVSGGNLVVGPLDVSLPVSNLAVITLSSALLVAKIVDLPGGGHSLGEIRVAGRWSIAEALRVAGSFEAKVDAGRICENTDATSMLLLAFFQTRICEASDIRASPGDDGKGKACDAVSIAVRVQASPASLGALRTVDTTGYCANVVLDCSK